MHRQSVWMPPHPVYRCTIFVIFMPNALSAATLTIYPGLGHTHTHWCVCVHVRVCVGQVPNNAGLHTQWLGLCSNTKKQEKLAHAHTLI